MDQYKNSLSKIFEQNREALLRFLRARTRDHAMAEDLLQDVWIKISPLAEESAIENPLGYIYKTCENAVRDAKRSASRQVARDTLWAENDSSTYGQGEDHLTPEKIAFERDQLRQTLAELEKLPERTRRIFVDFRINERPQKDIAADHAISISAVEKHLQRAYRVIRDYREKIEEDGAGGGVS